MSKFTRSPKQQLFMDNILGILVYSVVLGFFNDYTKILTTSSYSTTFLVAIVMQFLTFITLQLKKSVVNHFMKKEGKQYKLAMGFIVWLIMFFSKFVFLEVIDILFGSAVEISGFIGLVLIIIIMIASKGLIDHIYKKLA